MIVVVEGPDGSGKTRLCEAIAKAHDLPYFHEGPPPEGVDVLQHYLEAVFRATAGGGVFDRLALGERVYGPILRKNDRLGPDGWDAFAIVSNRLGVRNVCCLPPMLTAKANWRTRADRGAELIQPADELVWERTYFRFAHFTAAYGLAAYDYTRDNESKFIKGLEKW